MEPKYLQYRTVDERGNKSVFPTRRLWCVLFRGDIFRCGLASKSPFVNEFVSGAHEYLNVTSALLDTEAPERSNDVRPKTLSIQLLPFPRLRERSYKIIRAIKMIG